MDFITEYPHLCPDCQRMIKAVAEALQEGPDTDDPEAPAMYAYDHNMYCGGHECIGGGWDRYMADCTPQEYAAAGGNLRTLRVDLEKRNPDLTPDQIERIAYDLADLHGLED